MEQLAIFMEQAGSEQLDRFMAHARKAGVSIPETRDSADVALVSQMLMPMLEAIGSSVDVPKLRKRVRDDASIHNANQPWRRLPFWLVLRVAVQRHLCLSYGNAKGRACYKFLLCAVLARLLEDCARNLAPELTILLRAKLCRRLAKLEMDNAEAPPEYESTYRQLSDSTSCFFSSAIKNATSAVELAWKSYQKAITPTITPLPLQASRESLRLTLDNSAEYLGDVLLHATSKKRKTTSDKALQSDDDGATADKVQQFTDQCCELAELEEDTEQNRAKASASSVGCVSVAKRITDFVHKTRDTFECNPEQASIVILNIFDLWTQMDEYAVSACPLLAEYHPGFRAELLDVLQLPMLRDMERLQKIQKYLRDRCVGSRFGEKTMLSSPDRECFAARFVSESAALGDLQREIMAESERSKDRTGASWRKAYDEYDELTEKIFSHVCTCIKKPHEFPDSHRCDRCRSRRRRKKLRVKIHEDFLPSDPFLSAAMVFELATPDYLAAYRDATWTIIRELAHPDRPSIPSPSPNMRLGEYQPLKRFTKTGSRSISIASSKKSFLQTHYKDVKMKAEKSAVVLPHGPDFRLYDNASGLWVDDLRMPFTFNHLCGISVRKEYIFTKQRPSHDPEGPSSYEAIASQNRRPADVSAHEFLSYQRLLSGRSRRWLSLLAELTTSNLNFSSEHNMHLVSQLAIQAGPTKHHTGVLRDVHAVFHDSHFCHRLAEQIKRRLCVIKDNWREVYLMEILITLSLRLFCLADPSDRSSASELIKMARETTLQWISRVREHVWNCSEAKAAEGTETYGVWAALLCRRTFSALDRPGPAMSADELSDYAQASLALQQHLVVDVAKLSPTLRTRLSRDLKTACRLRDMVREAIQRHPTGLNRAINAVTCFDPTDASRPAAFVFGEWRLPLSRDDQWVSCKTQQADRFSSAQTVRYNYINGQFLVDGSPMGKLPLQIRKSEEVKELFGDRHLLTFPSPRRGMNRVLSKQEEGQRIHFGLRQGQVVIHAVRGAEVLEFVPRKIFSGPSTCDLPSSLVDNCVHWLNLQSGCLVIRRSPAIWYTRPRDWVMDFRKRQAQRGNVLLVDPRSDLSREIAGIMGEFGGAQNLTIYQPLGNKSRLSVEIKKLDLNFVVNDKHLLECRELRAEIDPNQDAGTLYGFRSKLVLRSVDDEDKRSIVAPLGALSWRRDGVHVHVRVANTDSYGQFTIDSILGRLVCPSEPRLLYVKALIHALTSFPLADALTGRTGTEEAMHTLESGCCRPWQPLGDEAIASLVAIRSLAPVRKYYPVHMRYMQTVAWDDGLTMTIQHENFEPLVESILTQSHRLRAFADKEPGAIPSSEPDPLLRRRALTQRLRYERIFSDQSHHASQSLVYQPRDREATSAQALRVYQTTKLVYHQPPSVHIAKDLKQVLQRWGQVGGFHPAPDRSDNVQPLADLVGGDVARQWGTLVDSMCAADPTRPYSAMFKLALLSFSPDPDMDVIRSLAAYTYLSSLRAIQPPRHPYFTRFKIGEAPTQESLESILSGAYSESDWAPLNNFDLLGSALDSSPPPKTPDQGKAEATRLAAFLLLQWPRPEPDIVGFETEVIDLPLALELILHEWQRLYHNLELARYLDAMQETLSQHAGNADPSAPNPWSATTKLFCVIRSAPVIPGLVQDLALKAIPTPSAPHSFGNAQALASDSTPHGNRQKSSGKLKSQWRTRESEELAVVLGPFVNSCDSLRQRYGSDLASSLAALDAASAVSGVQSEEEPPNSRALQDLIEGASSAVVAQLRKVTGALSTDIRFPWLAMAELWPCTSPVAVLQLLRSVVRGRQGRGLGELLLSYGVTVARLQRLHRVKSAQLMQDASKAMAEWRNVGHQNWDPSSFPDWLLLEIDANLSIRPEQVQVAHAIISPASGSNSVLQMNMGSGKTSCIVPMAMSVLADGTQLARLIVPRALLSQAASILQARLGGLVGREIRHVPFSRRTPTGPAAPGVIPLYSEHHEQIRASRGILLTTPENILSYKLAGLQRLADDRFEEADPMIKFHAWLGNTCRDVLDESDFTLAVKTQLIYPSGPRLPLDGHPYRWTTIQLLLSLVEDHLPSLERDFPGGLEVARQPDSFPVAFFLHNEVEDELNRRIVQDVSNRQTRLLLQLTRPTGQFPGALLQSLLSADSIKPDALGQLTAHFADPKIASDTVLLIHGLLAKRILLLCLKKRWNVQYGFHPGRQPIAVPFNAKGVPSEQSEFGHPDVAITLTCLSFYYAGLTKAQFRGGLQSVLRSGDPAAQYSRWTQGCRNLPHHLSHWNAVNVDDTVQFDQLWSRLRFNRGVLHHYMNTFVFPAHAKQLEVKIQASGWDIPLVSLQSDPTETGVSLVSRGPLTTGFSGTNDNRMMLPLTIQQSDLESLSQTNAEVLTYLLQLRNRTYHCVPRLPNREEKLLEELSRSRIRVLIDAGAYILEQDNEGLANMWLLKDNQAKAAVYFGTDNQAWVQIRNSNRALLITTPFADKLDECLVYLDEAHTRGVDLKLPLDARGALTLALGQTKDHTVQGEFYFLSFFLCVVYFPSSSRGEKE